MAIGATTVGTGGDWPPSFSLGDQQCIGPPELLGRGFQKARHFTARSHQNAGFSIWVFKNFPGVVIPPDPYSGRGRPPFAPNTEPGLFAGRGSQAPRCWDPNLGPLNFSVVVAALSMAVSEWYRRNGRSSIHADILTMANTYTGQSSGHAVAAGLVVSYW